MTTMNGKTRALMLLCAVLSLSACGGGDDTPAAPATRVLALDFTAVDKNQNDLVTVPAGYQVSILHALGDPQHFGDTSWTGDGSESADRYAIFGVRPGSASPTLPQ